MRLALVVHPTRRVDDSLDVVDRWAGKHGIEVVEIPTDGGTTRDMAPTSDLRDDDLVVTLGGDGTVLSALRAAAPHGVPVLGVACGSVGALAAVRGHDLERALDRFQSGDWIARRVPALAVRPDGAGPVWAINDFVVTRRGAGQVIASLFVDDELYVRLAGDGLIVATPLGSSAYSMAAGGPVLAPGTNAIVCTPLAMHGGTAAPLVVPTGAVARVEVHPSFAGFDIEIDGHRSPLQQLDYRMTLEEDKVKMVEFGGGGRILTGLRERGLITDSPRVLARDHRLGK
jgi:NAD+ kinase